MIEAPVSLLLVFAMTLDAVGLEERTDQVGLVRVHRPGDKQTGDQGEDELPHPSR